MSSFLVTGSNRGVGLALVKHLNTFPASAVGAIYATSRSSDPGEPLEALIKESGGRITHVPLEVTSAEGVKRAAQQVSTAQGQKGLDVLVNNAGTQDRTANGAPEALTPEEFQRVFDVNVMAPHVISQAFLPLLRQGREKKVINITSTLGSTTFIQQGRYAGAPSPAYKITKAALNALTVQWSLQLQSEGFIVKSISPGWLQTDMGTSYAPLPASTGAAAVTSIIMNEGRESTGRFRNIKVDGARESDWMVYDGSDAPF